jgi:hypothetical protein
MPSEPFYLELELPGRELQAVFAVQASSRSFNPVRRKCAMVFAQMG